MAKKPKLEVTWPKQEVGFYLGDRASYREMDQNLDPLGYIGILLMPNMAKESKQEVESHLENRAS